MSNDAKLRTQLISGPAVLFLGQHYSRVESGEDRFLSETLRKYGSGLVPSSYYQLFETSAAQAGDSAIAWMHRLCDQLPAPTWLGDVARFPWNAVFSSAIDTSWLTAFRAEWRTIQPIMEEKFWHNDPRNRLSLHTTFLFGSVSQQEIDQRPPLTRFQWQKRRHVALALARRLPEVITPLGCLVIEGYGAGADWFTCDDLGPILDEFASGQVHIFSPAPSLAESADFADLATQGKITFHHESIAQFFKRAFPGGIQANTVPGVSAASRHVFVAGESKPIEADTWNQIARSGILLDTAVVHAGSERIDTDEEYRRFRAFIASVEGVPSWDGFARGFAFRRDFETKVRDVVDGLLPKRRFAEEPIIVHGQTGTGKTTALAALALNIARQRTYPVLFIERKIQQSNQVDVDKFCRWAETEGAEGELIVWDGMLGPDDYLNILRYLSGKGRKVILVGSCYKLIGYPKSDAVVEAPAVLTSSELGRFTDYLNRFQPELSNALRTKIKIDNTFLSALYRFLPPSQTGIRTGVVREVNAAEQKLWAVANELTYENASETTLQAALRKVGFFEQQKSFSSNPRVVGDELVNDMQDLTVLVMVPGQFGLNLPFELLMRTLGKRAGAHLSKLFSTVDIFKWNEDEVANVEVGPRNSLEAQLFVDSRLGSPATEVAFIQRLLLEVRESGASYGGDREINFAVDLLVRLTSSTNKDYRPCFRDIATTLTKVREERGFENPRLMLQEAHLIREWAAERQRSGQSADELSPQLTNVEKLLRRALDQAGLAAFTKSYLQVELASSLASHARLVQERPRDAIRYFEEARTVLRQARVANPNMYHPIDVLYWATRDLAGLLNDNERVEALADVFHMFQTADPSEFDLEHQERFQTRRLECGRLFENSQMADDAFKELEAQGSTAGYYLEAYLKSGLPETSVLDVGEKISEKKRNDNLARLDAGLGCLQHHRQKILNDSRCLDLLLELWWLTHVKHRLLERERVTLPLSLAEHREVLDIILDLERTGESYRPVLVSFLRALVAFHLGDIEQSIELFKLVENESSQIRGRWRIVRSYIASTATGEPRRYTGTVSWVSHERGKGEVYVEQLRRRLQFIPHEFGRPDIRVGEALGDFHVSFNFIGPIAEPAAFYKAQQKRAMAQK